VSSPQAGRGAKLVVRAAAERRVRRRREGARVAVRELSARAGI
jgi:hypothetical protein